jgi:hypothetical protein
VKQHPQLEAKPIDPAGRFHLDAAKLFDVGPELQPGGSFRLGQLGQGLRAAHAVQDCTPLPAL